MSDQQIKSNARDQKKPFFLNKNWPQKSEHQRFLFDIIYRVMTVFDHQSTLDVIISQKMQ